jgi:chromosome segregation ATPase
VTKRIPEKQIANWPEISQSVLEQIGAVLRRAKGEITLTRRDAQKEEEANEILSTTIRKLERHFSETSVPPQAKALHFNLDYLTTHNEGVRRELTTARHRNQLLKEQIEKMAADLEMEDKLMNETKENALQWSRQWKSQEKKQVGNVPLCPAEYR